MNTIISLAKEFIKIPSTKDKPEELLKIIETAKKQLQTFSHKEFLNKNKPSILFYNTNILPQEFKIILNAHLDVVHANKEQFNPTVKDGKLYGRGSSDMKATAATMIILFNEIAKKVNYPLGLQLTTDEEVGGYNGTAYQITKGVRAQFIISGELTNLSISTKAKGILMLKLLIKGKTGHSAYPWEGENALVILNKTLSQIFLNFPIPDKDIWATTVNLAKIETANNSMNTIPDSATALLEIRYIPEDKSKIIDNLKRLIPPNITMEILGNEPNQFTDEENPFVIKLRESTKKITGKNAPLIYKHGASDIRHYNKQNIPGVVFGPIGQGLHSDNECIDLDSLSTYYNILKEFLLLNVALH